MRLDDYEAVYALWLSCEGMGLNQVDESREGIRRYLDRNPGTSFVAVEGETLAGVIMAGHDGRRGYIYHAAVRPDCRGRGIGSRLAEAALDALRSCGISKVALFVFKRNGEGGHFWERMGFGERTDLAYRDRALVDLVRIDT